MVESISVMGLGKLGAPLAAAFAARGFRVIGVDVDSQKIDAINRGLPLVYEPGLEALMKESEGRLSATQNAQKAVMDSEATFIMVNTPSEPGGGFSLRNVLPAVEVVGKVLKTKPEFHLVVLTSTVMPGSTGGEVRSLLERTSGKKCCEDFGLCYSPEFIALGSVIRDFYFPDFLLIGESHPGAGEMLAGIYQRTCKNTPFVARMNFINAEVTKLAVNTYLTTKISYANMIARLCEKLPDADASVVTSTLGLDTRIGPKYIKGAVSYGGPCFPRDNRALAALAARMDVSSGIPEAIDQFNRAQIKSIAEIVKSYRLKDGVVGILGLTYKPDTEVTEEAFGLLLANELSSSNLPLIAFDPCADVASGLGLCKSVCFASSAQECINRSDIIVLATPWQEFCEIPAERWVGQSCSRIVIDCWRAVDYLERVDGLRYIRLGLGPEAKRAVRAPSVY